MPRARSATSSSGESRRRQAKPCGSSRVLSPRTAPCAISSSTNRAAASSGTSICWCRPRTQGSDGLHHHGARGYPANVGVEPICVATVLLDAGILPMQEPETHFTLEAPGGLVAVTAECRNSKAERISIENVPSFADRLDAPLEVAGLGSLKVDIAYGGDSFVIVDAAALGFTIAPDEARDLAGRASESSPPPTSSSAFPSRRGGWDHISFCQFAGALDRHGNELQGPNAVVVRPGKIDRSPTGTGCSARMATLAARGLMTDGDIYRARSIIGSEFLCRIARPARSAAGRPSFRSFPAGPGLPASTSICSTRPIHGPRAIGSRTHGRALGGRFERFARVGAQLTLKWR